MLEAWHCQNRGRFPQAYAHLDRIDEMIESGACESCDIERLRGGVDALRSQQRYWLGQGELALKHIEQALKRLPDDCLAERGFAILHKAGALQICGQSEQARQLIYHLLSDTSMPVGTYQGRLLLTLCFLNWIAADLLGVRRAAAECLEIGEKLGLDETASFGRYFLGIVHYQRNELSEAEAMLHPVALLKRAPNVEFLCETVFALASAHQAQGRAEKAAEVVQSLSEFLLSLRNTDLLRSAEAFEAELAFRQGRIAKAKSWARGFNPEPFTAQSRFYEPRLTLAKVLIAEGSAESRTEADRLLKRLGTFFASIHNDRFLIETLAVQALLHHARGNELAAREALGVAVSLAQPGGLIRVFVDLGPELASLLTDLDLDEEGQRHVGRILAAFGSDRGSQPGAPASTDLGPLASTMTNRELDILGLLAERLSRQEIADRLHISTATVKRHAENIYSKLHVTGRRQAVVKARELDILSGARGGTA